MMARSGDELLKPPAAAELLQRSVQTLAGWRCAKRGPPYVLIEGRVLYRRGDLATFVQRGTVDPSRPQPAKALTDIDEAVA